MTSQPMDVLERANAVLERALKLDEAFDVLHAFRSLLENLKSRGSILLPREQLLTAAIVRASLLRSAIGVAVAILDAPDPRRRNRAGFGEILVLLKGKSVVDLLTSSDPMGSRRRKLSEVRHHYNKLVKTPLFSRVRDLRHNEIGHLLISDEPIERVEYNDVLAITDEIEALLVSLFEGLDRSPAFIEKKKQAIEGARLFWDAF
jgi:hypothetical protein